MRSAPTILKRIRCWLSPTMTPRAERRQPSQYRFWSVLWANDTHAAAIRRGQIGAINVQNVGCARHRTCRAVAAGTRLFFLGRQPIGWSHQFEGRRVA